MPDDLEHELGKLIPIAPSRTLDSRIQAALTLRHALRRGSPIGHAHSASSSDRFLLSTLTAAAASFILIITLLTTDYLASPPSSPALTNNPGTFANSHHLLAQLTGDSSPPP